MEKQTPYAQRLMRTKYQQDLKDYSDGTKNMEDLNVKHIFILQMSGTSKHNGHPISGEVFLDTLH